MTKYLRTRFREIIVAYLRSSRKGRHGAIPFHSSVFELGHRKFLVFFFIFVGDRASLSYLNERTRSLCNIVKELRALNIFSLSVRYLCQVPVIIRTMRPMLDAAGVGSVPETLVARRANVAGEDLLTLIGVPENILL